MKVYLDNSATTPVKKEVLEAMLPYFGGSFGNPSSIHSFGREAKQAVETSREVIAKFFGAKSAEIIFTGSGSESDNLAIKGIIKKIKYEDHPHIITSQIEHHAVLHACQTLEKQGLAEVTYLKPNLDGIIEVESVKKAIKKNTVLVTIMYVNNEIGTVQPIREIGKMIEATNRERSSVNGERIYFHTDAVQAAEYQNMNVDFLHVDLVTIAGHKIGAPKGIGVLYRREGTPLASIIDGGEQERGLRAGTENVPYIVGLAEAIEIITNYKVRSKKIEKLRDYFIGKVQKEIPDVQLNGSKENRSPHIVNLYFKNIEGESIVLALDLEGVAASTGSACTSQSLEPSHVLMACFDNHFRAAGSVRFSLSAQTTQKELDYAILKIKKVVARLREISPYK